MHIKLFLKPGAVLEFIRLCVPANNVKRVRWLAANDRYERGFFRGEQMNSCCCLDRHIGSANVLRNRCSEFTLQRGFTFRIK